MKALGVPEKATTDVKTDCIVMAGLAKKHEAGVRSICPNLRDLGNLRRQFEKVAPGQGFLNSFCEMFGKAKTDSPNPANLTLTEKALSSPSLRIAAMSVMPNSITLAHKDVASAAFRYEPAKQLQGHYRIPHTDAAAISDLGGRIELDEASSEAHVLAGGSLAVTGYGGTGKSFWAAV